VRELAHVLERSVLYARYDVISAADLLITEDQPTKDMFAALPEPREGFSVEEYLEQARKQLFLRALAACKGNHQKPRITWRFQASGQQVRCPGNPTTQFDAGSTQVVHGTLVAAASH